LLTSRVAVWRHCGDAEVTWPFHNLAHSMVYTCRLATGICLPQRCVTTFAERLGTARRKHRSYCCVIAVFPEAAAYKLPEQIRYIIISSFRRIPVDQPSLRYYAKCKPLLEENLMVYCQRSRPSQETVIKRSDMRKLDNTRLITSKFWSAPFLLENKLNESESRNKRTRSHRRLQDHIIHKHRPAPCRQLSCLKPCPKIVSLLTLCGPLANLLAFGF
jgi:hypothetical protein